MSYSPDQIESINDASILRQRIAELDAENERLQGEVQWCQNRIEIYEYELRRKL